MQLTSKQINEGNKLIARFMGYEYYPWNGDHKKCFYGWQKPIFKEVTNMEKLLLEKKNFLCRNHKELRYHRDWNWLMEAVNKIESIHLEGHGYFSVGIASNSCTIQGTELRLEGKNKNYAYYSNTTASTKIESTYIAVTSFIEWYNEKVNY